ncbi:hypothetical protein L1049_027508 [Liquidambar formosana]|uniref:DUF1421 domain-containing protein n=1 Tax=Liquidambar formosana TaxID=63359 RepID=A0AAP0RKY6_LIQFO
MKTSEFMDKQIMELSRSHSHDFSGFDSPPEDDDEEEEEDHRSYGVNKDDLLPTYDLHSFRNCSSTDHIDSAKVARKKVGTLCDAAFISVIDRKIKEHADNLMHAVEGISARISQLESRTRHLENSMDELKESAEYNHGSIDGKLTQLENILREVHGGVQDLRDKQEIAEAQLQLAKLQVSKGDPQTKKQNSTIQTDTMQEMSSSAPQQSHQPPPIPVNFSHPFPALLPNAPPYSSAPQQSHQPPPIPVNFTQPFPALVPNAPPYLPHQNPTPAAAQLPPKLHQNEVSTFPQPDSYYPAPAPTPETTHQQYYMNPTQQSHPPPPAPHQPYQLASQVPQISQATQLPQPQSYPITVNPQVRAPLGHHPEGTAYMPSQIYHQSIQQSSPQQPHMAPPTQQFYVASTQQMHDQTSSRPNSEIPTGYSSPPGHTDFNDLYSYSRGSSSRYGKSTMKPSQLSPPPLVSSGGSSYPQLPTAQILPYALPTASSVSGGSGSGGTGNRDPIDDLVDKVTAMGFRRDLVRATVKKLKENGQSVDLNVILDKLDE